MFGRNSKVNLELNREVEKLIKTGGKEQLLPIVQAGEPVLRQQTAAYEGQLSRKTLDKLIETMRVTMIEAPGVGLAATQIGLDWRLPWWKTMCATTMTMTRAKRPNSHSTSSSTPAMSRSAPKPAASTKAA